MSDRFPSIVLEKLLHAGWFPGRKVPLPDTLPIDFEIFHAAEVALQEFGGLQIGSVGPGERCATSDIVFRPELGAGASDSIGRKAPDGSRIFPLGEIHNGHALLLIDESGKTFIYFDYIEFLAASLDEALKQLLAGSDRKSYNQ